MVPALTVSLGSSFQPFSPAVQDLLCPLGCVPSPVLVSGGFFLEAGLSVTALGNLG